MAEVSSVRFRDTFMNSFGICIRIVDFWYLKQRRMNASMLFDGGCLMRSNGTYWVIVEFLIKNADVL